MIKIKNKKEIELLREGGQILAAVINKVVDAVKPGASTKTLNELAEKLIQDAGGTPSFKGYKAPWSSSPFPSALCISINDEVVHGLPANREIKDGDVVGVDCGLKYRGLFTDMAVTVIAGSGSSESKKLVDAAKASLDMGIAKIGPGVKLSSVSKAIQNQAEKSGFSVVRQLAGHGVGHSVHEPPQILNYVESGGDANVELKEGMVLAIEPMVNVGGWEVECLTDGWTIVTMDNSLSAHFEHTVVVTATGLEILTT